VFERTRGVWAADGEAPRVGNAAAGDQFGISVAIDGDYDRRRRSGRRRATGAAYAFVRTGSAWTQQAIPVRPAGNAGFVGRRCGCRCAGTRSSPARRGFSGSGAAFVFVRGAGT